MTVVAQTDHEQERPRHATFVFADLAGYTALTEAHGDDFAADIAVTFCSELNRLLPDGAEDLESLGDACMVRVPRADDAVRFGLALVTEAGRDRPFPHVRIGMHTGTAVHRGGDWYGATVNIAARVAAQASPGQVLLTAATELAAAPPPARLDDLGTRTLRHVRLPLRLFAARPERGRDADGQAPVDPICRLRVRDRLLAPRRELQGRRFVFCSPSCAAAFDADPAALSDEPIGEAAPGAALPVTVDQRRRTVLTRAGVFVGSSSLIFILLGLGATAAGTLLSNQRDTLQTISGVMIIALGLLLAASLFITGLNRQYQSRGLIERAGAGGPVIAGAAFALAWTPCVGPTLASILGPSVCSHSSGSTSSTTSDVALTRGGGQFGYPNSTVPRRLFDCRAGSGFRPFS